ncbi:MAG: hypothetical protein AAFR88_12195 [Pseudomonadota bacterium]
MTNISVLNETEVFAVAGGNPAPGQSWYEYLTERFPGGEWVGNSFFPNGVPQMQTFP